MNKIYTRSPQGRFPREVRVPKNYAGNAFRTPLSEDDTAPIFIEPEKEEFTSQETIQDSNPKTSENESISTEKQENEAKKSAENEKNEHRQAGLFSFPKFDLGLGKIFSRGGISLGFEELLILGLILLIASEGKGDDLILLLILLLFIQ